MGYQTQYHIRFPDLNFEPRIRHLKIVYAEDSYES
jgi:hypothetical protein